MRLTGGALEIEVENNISKFRDKKSELYGSSHSQEKIEKIKNVKLAWDGMEWVNGLTYILKNVY
jgi:hypothetical protein